VIAERKSFSAIGDERERVRRRLSALSSARIMLGVPTDYTDDADRSMLAEAYASKKSALACGDC